MNRLSEGVYRFRHGDVARYRRLFERLAREGQHPHSLFVSCADSRVVANLLTHSDPGDLFNVKNVGNVVPPDSGVPSHSIAAAIEYAVSVLEVRDIVVCGHSQCGAMRALLEGLPPGTPMPHLAEWMRLLEPVRRAVEAGHADLGDPGERVNQAARRNIAWALDNLRTYPCVTARLAAGKLRLHGWMFTIASAEVEELDERSGRFVPLGV
jgi:carbonic anhydrase